MTARSATAFIVVGILLITYMLRGRVRGLLVALCAVIPLTFFVGPYLQDRLGSTAVTGSSANFRLVAPLTVISDTLSNAPLGNFLGSSKEVMATYQLLNGASAGASLDNGVYSHIVLLWLDRSRPYTNSNLRQPAQYAEEQLDIDAVGRLNMAIRLAFLLRRHLPTGVWSNDSTHKLSVADWEVKNQVNIGASSSPILSIVTVNIQ